MCASFFFAISGLFIYKYRYIYTPRKLTWQWKITLFNRRYIFKWLEFSICHVSFLGCTYAYRLISLFILLWKSKSQIFPFCEPTTFYGGNPLANGQVIGVLRLDNAGSFDWCCLWHQWQFKGISTFHAHNTSSLRYQLFYIGIILCVYTYIYIFMYFVYV